MELSQDCAFVGAGLGVPLGTRSATGEEGEGVILTGGFGERRGGIEEEFCAAVWGEEFFVSEEAAFLRWRGVFFWEGPLDAALFVEVLVALDAGDVAGLVGGELLEEFEGGGWGGPFFEHFATAPGVGKELEDAEVGEGLAGGVADLFEGADAAFGVDEGATFFAPGGGWKEEVRGLGGLGGGIHVLDDEEVQFFA